MRRRSRPDGAGDPFRWRPLAGCARQILHHGSLAFSALVAGDGPETVLCLHGFPDHNRTWRHLLPALSDAGYRAVAPMLRGYEPSCQPGDGDYHLVRLAEDVIGWLDDLGVDRCHLVGHDWGAAIGYVTAAMAPDRLMTLTTLAVPHLRGFLSALRGYPSQLRKSWYMFFFQLRGLAEWRLSARAWALVERLWRDWSPGWTAPRGEMRALEATLARPGVRAAALAYYRALFDPLSRAARRSQRLAFGRVPAPTLALTGADDGCIDTRLFDLAMDPADFPAGLRVERLAGCGHFLHLERPEPVHRLILDWIGGGAQNTTS